MQHQDEHRHALGNAASKATIAGLSVEVGRWIAARVHQGKSVQPEVGLEPTTTRWICLCKSLALYRLSYPGLLRLNRAAVLGANVVFRLIILQLSKFATLGNSYRPLLIYDINIRPDPLIRHNYISNDHIRIYT